MKVREYSRGSSEEKMKKLLIATAVGVCLAGQVAAQESPWMVRARAVQLDMKNSGNTATTSALTVDDKTIPEVDITYFFNKNIAAELILTVPQKQHVYLNGADLGTFKHLPPTLTLQYHFTNFNGYKPYVGAGVNLTKIGKESIKVTNPNDTQLDNTSTGLALQAGVDIPLTKQVFLNFDVKKVQLKSDVYVGGANVGTLKLNPVLVGVGVGYRF
jgi:outer membrane protein